MKIFWTVAFRNLKAHWRQSLAALLSIAIGFATLALFEGYISYTKEMMETDFRLRLMYGDINIEKKDLWTPEGREFPWKYALSPETQEALADFLANDPEVDSSSRFLRINGMAKTPNRSAMFMGLGYELKGGQKLRGPEWAWGVLYGVPLEESPTNSATLGQLLAKKLGCFPETAVSLPRTLSGYPAEERPFKCPSPDIQLTAATSAGQANALNVVVTGMVDAGFRDLDERFLYIPLEVAQTLARTQDVSYISVLLKDPDSVDSFLKRIEEFNKINDLNLNIIPWQNHRIMGDAFRKTASFLSNYRNFIGLIIFCIAALSVLNTMLKIVSERTREIGTWRSLGYTKRHITSIFVCEAIALALTGCGIGLLATIFLATMMNSLGVPYNAGIFVEPYRLSIAIVPQFYIFCGVILILICTGASLIATRRIITRTIADNLVST